MQGVSVIICSYNSEDKIGETLKHLSRQDSVDVPWEIILVNNNSNDLTVETAKKNWSNKTIPLRILDENRPGLNFARITGVEAASFDILSFVDDDNLVPPNWISYISEKFNRFDIGILGFTSIGKFNFTPEKWYNKKIHQLAFATGSLYDSDFAEITKDGLVYGAGLTIQKDIFKILESKNWKPILTDRIGKAQSGGGDSEICLAARLLGYSIYYSNEIKTQHNISEDRLTWERLKNVTRGFGAADVFLTPYNYYYLEQTSQLTFSQSLRKFWWFNYLGKKASLNLWTVRHKLGQIDNEDFEILKIRLQAFCETILTEKKRFKESFQLVRGLIK